MKTTNIILPVCQVILICGLAPLVSGLICKLKNNIRMRNGAGLLQPYYNMAKLFSKDEVISGNASWIFRVTPAIVLTSSIAVCFLLPVFGTGPSLNALGDMLAIAFILALGRFFLALAGLDTGSAFGGMGSSREMFISSIAEPAALVSFFVLGLNSGSTSLGAVAGMAGFKLSNILAALSLFMVVIAETSRIPVDNQETHLELTMVHEAMVLEYSGPSLALIEWAAHIKQAVFFVIISWVLFPAVIPLRAQIPLFILKIGVISSVIALLEVSVAKMRLFRVVDYLGFAFFISLLAAVSAAMGV